MTFDLEKARKIVGAMSPTPWIVLEDRYGQIDVIRNPNHPMHKEGVIELWGRASETATPDAIGISYMRSEFPNALDEIERLRAEISEQKGIIWKTKQVEKEQAARIKELEGREEDLFTCYNCGKKVDDVELGPILGEIHFDPGYLGGQYEPPEPACAYFVCVSCLNAEGKIGPEDAKPRSWQITDERVEALWYAIKVLKENDIMEEPEEHLWDEEVTVLQAMLTEADHDKP